MSRPTAWLAWSLCALSLASVIVWALFRILNSPTPRGINQTPLLFEIWGLLVFVLFTTVGALVDPYNPRTRSAGSSVLWASPSHPQLRADSTLYTPW
jgi:uncharacterized membrane protein YhdT